MQSNQSNNSPLADVTLDPRQAVLDECIPFIRKLAWRYREVSHILDQDDLFQEGCLAVLKTMDHIPADSPDPGQYLTACARYAIMHAAFHSASAIRIPRSSQIAYNVPPFQVESLDVPHGSSDLHLYDVLPATRRDEKPNGAHIRALLQALERLSDRQRFALHSIYHLDTIEAPQLPATFNSSDGNLSVLRNRAIKALRQNAELEAQVCA